MRSTHEHIAEDAVSYRLLKLLHDNPHLSQRDLSREMGISLGKVNSCLRALMDKGVIKAANFKNARNKSAYLYILTPRGIEEKARITLRFLKRKMSEYDRIKAEIEELKRETDELGGPGGEGRSQ